MVHVIDPVSFLIHRIQHCIEILPGHQLLPGFQIGFVAVAVAISQAGSPHCQLAAIPGFHVLQDLQDRHQEIAAVFDDVRAGRDLGQKDIRAPVKLLYCAIQYILNELLRKILTIPEDFFTGLQRQRAQGYKALFSHSRMVEELIRSFVGEEFVEDIDCE